MYDFKKYKKVSYIVMYNAFNNMSLSQHNGITGFMFSGACNLHEGGSTSFVLCRNCKNSILVKVPFGDIFVFQYLCIYCINRLYNLRSKLDEIFTSGTNRKENFKAILKRCDMRGMWS